MFPLIDTSPQAIFKLASECGFPETFGQLLTPLTNYRVHPSLPFAIDNGGFSRACPRAFSNLLKKSTPFIERCLWVAVPDVPGDARRTLELFFNFQPIIAGQGFKCALVAQDGLEDMEIPWKGISAIFVGGTTEWKCSEKAKSVIRAAQWMGKKVHVGRINTGQRWEEFAKLGVDTFDGSALAKPYPGAHQQRAAIAVARSGFQLDLFSPN